MPVNPVAHPSAELLQSFNLGKLDDATAERVLRHLEACPACRQQLAALSGDSLLNRLRAAHQRSGTDLPAGALPKVAHGPQTGRSADSQLPGVADLPPALAENLQYHVMRELGRGGMGVVYLAKNVLMDRLEVLKVVNKALLDTPAAAERFLREIRSAAQLSHDNVVKAYSALSLGDVLVFAMEYIEGEDLARVVKQEGPLSVPRACFYAHQTALGLQHAHEHKMVHRDIKPHNLILSRQGKKHVVKVLDFGLAKATREGKADTGLTGPGMVMGTPDYIAPEQAMDAASADIRADIYSLGCTLYFLLSGAPPFQGKSVMEILQGHLLQEPPSVNLRREDVPAELAAVVAKMLAKEPAQRYQKPIEVAQALVPFVKAGTKEAPAGASQAGVGGAERGTRPEQSEPTETAGVWQEMVREGGSPVANVQKQATTRTVGLPASHHGVKKRWALAAVITACVLLIGLLGLWASGVFKVKTKDGTIVLETLPEDAEVGKGQKEAFAPKAQRVPAVAQFGKHWRLDGDELIQGSADNHLPTMLSFGDTSWTDYDLSVEARRLEGPALWCILFFRRENAFNWWEYRLLGIDNIRDYKTVSDLEHHKVIEKKDWLSDDNWHTIGLKVRGDRLEMYLDGKFDFGINDSRHPRGGVGLWTGVRTSIAFRNLRVTDGVGRVLVAGVGSLDLTGGQDLAPGTERFVAGTIWKGKVKSINKDTVEYVSDATMKVVKRAGAVFEGECWVHEQRIGWKIEGNVDQIGTITWQPTGILAGDLQPQTLEDRGLALLDNGKRIRAYTTLRLPTQVLSVEMTLALEH
jgi:hypothetical protein